MRRMFLLISVLLLSASWAMAQYSSGSSSTENQSNKNNATQGSESNATRGSSAANKTSLEGCLSDENGKFTLTDQSGTAYELTGRTAALKAHVGHTIRVNGTESMAGAGKPGAMSNEAAQAKPTFKVRSFRHISSTCKNPM